MRRLALLVLLASTARATDIFDIRVQKVADGIYLASRAEPVRPYVEGNVTIIVNEHDVVVVKDKSERRHPAGRSAGFQPAALEPAGWKPADRPPGRPRSERRPARSARNSQPIRTHVHPR